MRMIALETTSYSRVVGVKEDPITLEDIPIRNTILLDEGAYYALPEDLATEIVEAGIGYWEGDEKPMTRKQRATYERQARAAAEVEASKASSLARRQAEAPDAEAIAAEIAARQAEVLAARAAKAVDPAIAEAEIELAKLELLARRAAKAASPGAEAMAAEVEASKAAIEARRVSEAIKQAAAITASQIEADAAIEALLARRAAAKEARR